MTGPTKKTTRRARRAPPTERPATTPPSREPESPLAAPLAEVRDEGPARGAESAGLVPWSRYWLAPLAAVRPWLLLKLTLLLLAFDVLGTHLGPAWRYGAAGFNVPHFAWMEALPTPTTAAYVGMLFLVSTGALVGALVPRAPRWLLASLTVLYTWGWSCSMHDSYQHHYLLSVVLLAFTLFPPMDAADLFGASPLPREATHGLVPRVHALGFTMLTAACAFVYAFTARSKLEPDWLSGDAMRSITHQGQTIQGAIDLAASLGIEGDDFWWWLGHSVVPVQLVCFLGYALAPLLDGPSTAEERDTLTRLVGGWFDPGGRGPAIAGGLVIGALLGCVAGFALGLGPIGFVTVSAGLAALGASLFLDRDGWRFFFMPAGRRPRPVGLFAIVAMLTAISFHVGAEHLALEIGWFSAYMIVVALVVFLPARWLSLAAFVVTAPVRARARGAASALDLPRLVLSGLAGGASLVVMGQLADLPGAVAASAIATVVLAVAIGASLAGHASPRASTQAALACLFAGVAITGWLHVTDARFDYYRFAGGDFRRRLDYEAALPAYERANRYAPEGQSRDDRIEEMRERIRDRRGLPEPE